METKIIKVDSENLKEERVREAAKIIKRGGTVAFPTETVYGLGANGLDERAVERIFKAKGRPQDNPLILHIAFKEQLEELVKDIPEEAFEIMEKFWPGPLTLIFKKSDKVPDKITGGLSTVAIRMPNNKIALKIIELAKVPIAAPSANTSGRPSPTNATHVVEDLYGKINMVVDGGSTGIGVESTVLDMSGETPMILRPGGIIYEDLKLLINNVELDKSIIKDNENIIPKSPGQKYKHYAPKGKMIVYSGDVDNVVSNIKALAEKYIKEGKKVGIMATEETRNRYTIGTVLVVGSRENKDSIAKNLFNIIREFDNFDVDIILAEGTDTIGIGRAIMNRMKKASGNNVKWV
ncbi:MAG TPA: L-threonylcarbamoyladenylate synthase [Tissierellales bacterium]|nr:L-threonylcarbamoyladenylate synthase [Tissierellales bacterium]